MEKSCDFPLNNTFFAPYRVWRLFLHGFGDFSTGFMAAWPSLPPNTVETHHLHYLAVEPQLHGINVDGWKDGDYGTVLYLNFHPEKYFGFNVFHK